MPSCVLVVSALLCLGGSSVVFAALPGPQMSNETCPFSVEPRYAFYCGSRGIVQEPFTLSTSRKRTLEACADSCLANKNCKSVKYVARTATCVMYTKFLTEMAVTTDNFEPGLIYDYDCFTRDCNTIAACEATKNMCDFDEDNGIDNRYNQYACAYGFTAKTDGLEFTDTPLPANLTATCDVIKACVNDEDFKNGTKDIHFHIPSGSWVCRSFNELPGGQLYSIYSVREQHATHGRYTLRNSSVGAGYGFYLRIQAYN